MCRVGDVTWPSRCRRRRIEPCRRRRRRGLAAAGAAQAKSLLEVKDGDSFLDIIAKQVVAMRKSLGMNVRFVLMNSFSTSDDTKEFLCEVSYDVAHKDLVS